MSNKLPCRGLSFAGLLGLKTRSEVGAQGEEACSTVATGGALGKSISLVSGAPQSTSVRSSSYDTIVALPILRNRNTPALLSSYSFDRHMPVSLHASTMRTEIGGSERGSTPCPKSTRLRARMVALHVIRINGPN
jgi:hypothetical protein